MEFNGAQTETHINVPAETWQIDFTARLAGMDEAARLANMDIYGAGAFFESGFMVAKTGNQYFVTQGLGYIGGLRAALANNQNITLSAKPTKVWADVCYHGTVTSTYRTEIKITVAGNLANYTENGIAHYVFALASIDAAGVITDLRPKGSLANQLAEGSVLSVNNIKGDGKRNVTLPMHGLGVGPIAKTDAYSNIAQFYRVNDAATNKPPITGTAAGVVCLPIDGAPSTGYLAISIQGDAWIGRSGAAASGVTWTRIFTEKYSPTALGVKAADCTNNFAARMGVSRVLSGNNPPSSPGVWSVENCSWTPEKWGTLLCTTNKSDLSAARGEGQFLHYFFLGHSSKLYVAVNVNNTGIGWQQLIVPAGGNLNGPLSSSSWISAASMTAQYHTVPTGMPEGAGAFSGQLNTKAPLYQPNWQWPVTSGGLYVPIAKGVATRQGQGYPSAVSFGYLLSGTPSFAQACIHVKGDNADFNWRFDANSGNFYCPGGVLAAGAIFHVDGNITGNIWGGYLNTWLNNQFNARDNNINTRATWDYVNQNFVRDIRLASRGQIVTDGAMTEAPWGAVITGGNGNEGNQIGYMYFRYVQKNVNGNWYTVAYA